jgi:hypothetical protein
MRMVRLASTTVSAQATAMFANWGAHSPHPVKACRTFRLDRIPLSAAKKTASLPRSPFNTRQLKLPVSNQAT